MESNAPKTLNDTFETLIFSSLNQPKTNILISPTSMFQVLGLTANGAKQNTLQGMFKALSTSTLLKINDINKQIKNQALSTVSMANGIFTKFNPTQTFKALSNEYDAAIEKLSDLQQINKWCEKKTNGKIKQILKELNKDMQMILLNAVYFKGDWKNSFDEKQTQEKTFFNFGVEETTTKLMYSCSRMNYYEKDEQVVELPYKLDNMSAVIILPNKETDINAYINGLNAKKIKSIFKGLKQEKGELFLPKFEINYDTSIKSALVSLGMNDAFTDGADFSGIKKDGGIKIDEVLHKSLMKVDEKGTTAAAVTAVSAVKRGACGHSEPEKLFYMRVDRPFLFFLRNKKFPENHQMLFMGKIEHL